MARLVAYHFYLSIRSISMKEVSLPYTESLEINDEIHKNNSLSCRCCFQ